MSADNNLYDEATNACEKAFQTKSDAWRAYWHEPTVDHVMAAHQAEMQFRAAQHVLETMQEELGIAVIPIGELSQDSSGGIPMQANPETGLWEFAPWLQTSINLSRAPELDAQKLIFKPDVC